MRLSHLFFIGGPRLLFFNEDGILAGLSSKLDDANKVTGRLLLCPHGFRGTGYAMKADAVLGASLATAEPLNVSRRQTRRGDFEVQRIRLFVRCPGTIESDCAFIFQKGRLLAAVIWN